MSSTETVQFVGITGPIALSGTTTGTVNLYGLASSVTDSTSGATVTNKTDQTDGLNDLSAAEVNTQVLDVLNTDTFAEPGQEAPPATTTLAKKINYLYKFLRNKIVTDSTLIEVYDDAGSTVDQKSTISDDGIDFTRGEFGSGP